MLFNSEVTGQTQSAILYRRHAPRTCDKTLRNDLLYEEEPKAIEVAIIVVSTEDEAECLTVFSRKRAIWDHKHQLLEQSTPQDGHVRSYLPRRLSGENTKNVHLLNFSKR